MRRFDIRGMRKVHRIIDKNYIFASSVFALAKIPRKMVRNRWSTILSPVFRLVIERFPMIGATLRTRNDPLLLSK